MLCGPYSRCLPSWASVLCRPQINLLCVVSGLFVSQRCADVFSGGWLVVPLVNKKKIKGERGHPCLVPLVIVDGVESAPEVNTWADGWVYRTIMAEYVGPLKAYFPSTCERNCQCILSNAFSASKARKREGVLCLPAMWITLTRRLSSLGKPRLIHINNCRQDVHQFCIHFDILVESLDLYLV